MAQARRTLQETRALQEEIVALLTRQPNLTATQIQVAVNLKGYKTSTPADFRILLGDMVCEGLLWSSSYQTTDHYHYGIPKKFTSKHANSITWGLEHVFMLQETEVA